MEFFGWRQFANRREEAAAAGLTPTPCQSGASPRKQGISKTGNAWILETLRRSIEAYSGHSLIHAHAEG
jgi:transposase